MEKYVNNDINNKFVGDLYLENSKIKFNGKNNILYINGSVKLIDSSIEFRGDNSIVYICSTDDVLKLDVKLYNNCTLYFGKDIWINKGTKIVLSEQTNAFFGNECMISYDTCIRTGDPHLIYDITTHKRINHSKSVYFGDHVWIGQHVIMLKGLQVGSGSIIGAMSLLSNKKCESNSIYAGNPIKKIKSNIFFRRENCHMFIDKDIDENEYYYSDDYVYYNDDNTLSFEMIESKLKSLEVNAKKDYLNDITNNKNNNRFYIGE